MNAKRMSWYVPAGVAAIATAGLLIANSAQGEHCKKGEHHAKYLDAEHAPTGDGWTSLIDHDSLKGWEQRHTDRPMSWTASNGVLINFSSHDAHGTDIYTKEKFEDFEVYYEYLVAQRSNSGLYLRGRYEIQILDNRDEKPAPHTDGGFYSVAAPATDASKGAMKWQSVYAKLVGKTVTVIHNGKTIHDKIELPRPTGGHLDNDVDKPGPIMIQGDHGSLAVRNLHIRPIK